MCELCGMIFTNEEDLSIHLEDCEHQDDEE